MVTRSPAPTTRRVARPLPPQPTRRRALTGALGVAAAALAPRAGWATAAEDDADALECKLGEREIQIPGAYINECQTLPKRIFTYSEAGTLSFEQGQVGPGTTGAAVWNSAVLLADHMAGLGPSYWKGKAVLELGCGTGLPGLVAYVERGRGCSCH